MKFSETVIVITVASVESNNNLDTDFIDDKHLSLSLKQKLVKKI